MTTELDIELGQTALEILNEFGKAASFISVGVANVNLATLKATKVDAAPRTIRVYAVDATGWEIANGLGTQTSKKFFIAGRSFTVPPKPTDKLIYAGKTYTFVDSIKEHYSGDDISLYEIVGFVSNG